MYDPNSFEERSGEQKLVFNEGKAGVVTDCVIRITKRGADQPENHPKYKLEGWSRAQRDNTQDLSQDLIIPINKGFFVKNRYDSTKSKEQNKEENNFVSSGAEGFAVNELKHLLRICDHPLDEKGHVALGTFKDFEAYLDYTMDFCTKKLSENRGWRFDLAVDYGTKGYARDFLQLNGHPWYICRMGDKINNRKDSIMERPVADNKDEDLPYPSNSGAETPNEAVKNWLDGSE